MRSLITYLVLFILFLPASAQIKEHFYHLDINNGLSSNNATCVMKDSKGFVWVGTSFGLNRYDGYRFRQYFSDGRNGELWSNYINGLQEDGSGTIWVQIGTNYIIYNREKDRFDRYYLPYLKSLGISSDYTSYIYVDPDRNIWVSDKQKVSYYNFQKKQLQVYRIANVVGISGYKGIIHLIAKCGTLYTLNTGNGYMTLDNFIASHAKGCLDQCILFTDTQQGVWLYTNDLSGIFSYLFHYDAPLKKWDIDGSNLQQKGFGGDQVRAIMDDHQGFVWIATGHFGINVYSLKEHRFISNTNKNRTLISNNINGLYISPDNIIWIAYSKMGVSFAINSDGRFKPFVVPLSKNSEYKDDISSLLVDRSGHLWIGTDGNGLTVLDRNRKVTNHYDFGIENAVVSIYEDRQGRIWASAYRMGLYCFDHGRMTHYTQGKNGLVENNIWAITGDENGVIWIGGLSKSIQYFDEKAHTFKSVTPGNMCTIKLCSKRKGWIYAATSYGLLKINTRNLQYKQLLGNRRNTQKFSDEEMQDVNVDRRGLVWICGQKGLSVFDEKNDYIYYVNKQNGLCFNLVEGIIEDKDGHMWVTTSNGLSEIIVTHDGRHYQFQITNYGEVDGLQTANFSRGAATSTPQGTILVGGINGYSEIYSTIARRNIKKPTLTFTDLQIGNDLILPDTVYNGRKILDSELNSCKEVKLNYSDRLVTVYFSAFDFKSPERCRYAYRLNSTFSSNWVYTNDNKVTFNNLSPGTYHLEVKACNSDGVWGDPSTLVLHVRPPFWSSIWAKILYILLFAAIGYYIYRVIERRRMFMMHIQTLKNEMEKQRHVTNMKLQFFTNVSHDFRTPLSLIISPIEKLLEDNKGTTLYKLLDIIHRNAIQLLNLVNQLLDFRKLDEAGEEIILSSGNYIDYVQSICKEFEFYQRDRQIRLQFTSNVSEYEYSFDKDKIRKILMNLLSNAFKFSDKGSIVIVQIEATENTITTYVKDTGIGIPDNDKKMVFDRFFQVEKEHLNYGSGIGLHIVQKYVSMLGGNITLTDNQPHGCIFTFALPVSKNTQAAEQNDVQAVETVPLPTEEEKENIEGQKPVILIVEDNDDFRNFMEECLISDYNILKSTNGQEALTSLNNHHVDIIITDIMMPVMDGLELCRRIKSNINFSHIPVIMLTARTTEAHQQEGLEEGADEYITKPFNLHILKLRIEKLLQWSKNNHSDFGKKEITPSEITISSLDERLIEKAIKVVEAHMENADFSVEDLAQAVGLSRGHLYRKLMSITGKGPLEFIRILRLKRAKQYLEKSQMSISEIAYTLGFNTPKVFSKYFKEEFGESPSDYMKNHQ